MDLSRFLQALRQGCVDPVHTALYHKGGKGSPPPAPDYKGAAETTAKSQMTSQFSPYGSEVYSPDANSPSGYRQTINLAPDARATLDTQMKLSRGLAGVASDQLPSIEQFYDKPFDIQSMSQPAYSAITGRLDQRFGADENALRTRLANQGLVAGGEAFDKEMQNFNQSKNDAYQQAQLASLQNAMQFQAQPLNIFNAIRTGAQVQNPQFGQTPSANYLGAAQGQGQYDIGRYNADVAGQNAMMQGLFGLGSAGILAMSDRRLKSNIVRVGTHPLGIGIYEYDLFGTRQQGVMADEVETVKPEAVVEIGGYKHVNYGLLDG